MIIFWICCLWYNYISPNNWYRYAGGKPIRTRYSIYSNLDLCIQQNPTSQSKIRKKIRHNIKKQFPAWRQSICSGPPESLQHIIYVLPIKKKELWACWNDVCNIDILKITNQLMILESWPHQLGSWASNLAHRIPVGAVSGDPKFVPLDTSSPRGLARWRTFGSIFPW